jgi:hypothetical protein
MILAAPILVFILLLFLVLGFTSLTQEMGKKQPAQPTTAQHATTDQHTDDLFLASATLLRRRFRSHHILP